MFSLCLVTDRKLFKSQSAFLRALRAAVAGGADAVLLREKDITEAGLLLALAKKVKTVTSGAKLIISGRCDIVLSAGADGVHLTSSSIPVKLARKLLGSKKIIGKSCHSIKDVLVAQKEGANYVFLGPIYYTASKAAYGRPLGYAIIKSLFKNNKIEIPVLAIGGIIPQNTAAVMRAGADGVAVISGILKAKNPGLKTREYIKVLNGFRK